MEKMIRFLFLLLPTLALSQVYMGFGAGNTDFQPGNVSYSVNATYQPTVFGIKAQYYGDGTGDNSWQLQTTIEPFRGDFYTPVVSAGYDFGSGSAGTQPMVGLQNQMQVVPNVYITTGYEVIFEYRSPVMQYIYFGTVMQIVNPETRPKRFY